MGNNGDSWLCSADGIIVGTTEGSIERALLGIDDGTIAGPSASEGETDSGRSGCWVADPLPGWSEKSIVPVKVGWEECVEVGGTEGNTEREG